MSSNCYVCGGTGWQGAGVPCAPCDGTGRPSGQLTPHEVMLLADMRRLKAAREMHQELLRAGAALVLVALAGLSVAVIISGGLAW